MRTTKNWRPLKNGDLIDVVAPGFATDRKVLQQGVLALEKRGFRVRVQERILAKDLLCASPLESRARGLVEALSQEDSRAVWCLRGGYGSLALLPALREIKKPKQPKLVIGLSDITSLHAFLLKNWGWACLHAPLLDRVALEALNTSEERELFAVLSGEQTEVSFSKLKLYNSAPLTASQLGSASKSRTQSAGQASGGAKNKAPSGRALTKTLEGSIIGGNLTVLQSSIGTFHELRPKNSFLFIEDVGERAYRIDRIFEQMDQAGWFKDCKAVLIGQFTGGEESLPGGRKKSLMRPLLTSWADRLGIPFVGEIPSGHGKRQRPLPLGTQARLSLGESPSLYVQTGSSS